MTLYCQGGNFHSNSPPYFDLTSLDKFEVWHLWVADWIADVTPQRRTSDLVLHHFLKREFCPRSMMTSVVNFFRCRINYHGVLSPLWWCAYHRGRQPGIWDIWLLTHQTGTTQLLTACVGWTWMWNGLQLRAKFHMTIAFPFESSQGFLQNFPGAPPPDPRTFDFY